jgi:hypothetical protein
MLFINLVQKGVGQHFEPVFSRTHQVALIQLRSQAVAISSSTQVISRGM